MKRIKVFFKGKFYCYVKSKDDLECHKDDLEFCENYEFKEVNAPEFDVYYPSGDYAPETLTNISGGSISLYKLFPSGVWGVNWSAIGTVTPEHARIYAQAILKAAEIAEEMNKTRLDK